MLCAALAVGLMSGDPAAADEPVRLEVPPGTSDAEVVRMAREKLLGKEEANKTDAKPADAKAAAAKADSKPAEPAKPKTVKAEADRLKLTTEVKGRFVSDESTPVALRPQSWSRMEVVSVVPHGTKVREGETLIELELDDLERAVDSAERELAQAELAAESAELSLELLQKTMPIDVAAAERSVQQAEDDLAYYLNTTKDLTVKRTKESLESSEFQLEYAQEELDQLQQMYEADDLTEQTEEIILKRAQRAVKSAESYLESAQVRAKKSIEVDLPRREQSLRDATAKTVAGKKKTMAAMEAAMRQAELSLESKRLALEAAERKFEELEGDLETLSEITAPQAGYVYYGQFKNGVWGGKDKADQFLKPGGNLPAKTVLMTIVSPTITGLQASVSEDDISKLRTGMSGKGRAAVAPDATFEVTIESLGRVPISSGKFACLFGCDEVPAGVVPGMSVGGEDDERFVVFVGGKKRPVKVGKSKGDRVEILEGLRAGEEVREKAED